MRRRDAGFTLLELALAMAAAAMLGLAAFTFIQVGEAVQRQAWRRADAESIGRALEAALRPPLDRAATAGVSSPNFGPLRIGVAGGSGGETDTLTFALPIGDEIPVASRGCRIPREGCIVLLGGVPVGVEPGAEIVVGSRGTGHRVLQVVTPGAVYRDACGIDCTMGVELEGAAPVQHRIEQVVGGMLGGVAVSSCDEPYSSDGTACLELREIEDARFPTVPLRARSIGPVVAFTEIETVDRTARIGFPTFPGWTGISSGGALAISAVPVELTRFHTVPEDVRHSLVRSPGLRSDGSWMDPIRVAGPIAGFRLESLHTEGSGWIRGDGITPEMMATYGNPNRLERTVAGPTPVPGYSFLAGLHTRAAIGIRADVVGRDHAGRELRRAVWIVHSLTRAAEGGAQEISAR